MKYYLTLFLFIVATLNAKPAILSGTVTDEKDQPLSFASISIKGTTNGVTANLEGKYALQLQAGSYQIIFQYVGYEKRIESVTVADQPIILNVKMHPYNLTLKEVVINSDAEDPSYRVIREAIKKKKYYLEQVDAYSCNVYIKGVQLLDSIPKRILGFKAEKLGVDSTNLGIFYLSESESQYNFKQPDKVKEIMVSSKVSGDNKSFSWNQASEFDFNFYKNLLNAGELSDRGFVSPISSSAMLYYKYHLEGTFMDDGEMVNKIKVIPKRKNDPVFSGYIYIVENTWRIHSTDMVLTKDAKIDFVDSLEIKQNYAKVNDSVWMPFNQTMLFKIKVLGIKAHGRYVGVFRDYNTKPDFPKRFFKGELLKVNDDANKKDSAYWNTNRPVQLTQEEIDNYRKEDSLERIHNSKRYLDSLDNKYNKYSFLNMLVGFNYYKRASKTNYSISGLLPFLDYNTVEGWAPQLNLGYSKSWEDNRSISIHADVRYGAGNNLLSVAGGINCLTDPSHFTECGIYGGKFVRQINYNYPINGLVNSFYTLFKNQNYMKLYDNADIGGYFNTEIVNGITINTELSYNHRSPLNNTSYKTFTDKPTDTFTSNYPYADSVHSNFQAYNALIAGVGFHIKIKQKYYTRPHQKIIVDSKYPTIYVSYSKGIAGLGSNVNFDKVQASISDNIKLGLFGKSSYSVSGGGFLNNRAVGIEELEHFEGNQTIFASPSRMNAYQLLPYYKYSTNRYYAQVHVEHHFEGFLTNKIPIIKKLNLKEVIGVHYLYTPAINYTELNVGLEHLFKVIRVDFVSSYSNTLKLKSGFVVGLNLNF